MDTFPFFSFYVLVSFWSFSSFLMRIDRFRYIKISSKAINVNTKLWEIDTEFVKFIPQRRVLRSIVLSWILIYPNWTIDLWAQQCYYNNKNNWFIHLILPFKGRLFIHGSVNNFKRISNALLSEVFITVAVMSHDKQFKIVAKNNRICHLVLASLCCMSGIWQWSVEFKVNKLEMFMLNYEYNY